MEGISAGRLAVGSWFLDRELEGGGSREGTGLGDGGGGGRDGSELGDGGILDGRELDGGGGLDCIEFDGGCILGGREFDSDGGRGFEGGCRRGCRVFDGGGRDAIVLGTPGGGCVGPGVCCGTAGKLCGLAVVCCICCCLEFCGDCTSSLGGKLLKLLGRSISFSCLKVLGGSLILILATCLSL